MRWRRALDDIVDHSENVAAQLGLYGVEAPMEQAVEFTEVLVGAGEQIAQALRCLRNGTELGPHLVEIHRLENEGDRLQRDGVASLFAGGIDPMVVIRWKDIFESLEAAVDACETVAHVLEGITLKQRRREGFDASRYPKLAGGAETCRLAPCASPTRWPGTGRTRQAPVRVRPPCRLRRSCRARRATANSTSSALRDLGVVRHGALRDRCRWRGLRSASRR